MTKDQLAKQIYQVSSIKGTFRLRSGGTSTEYFDKYLFESKPEILDAIAVELSSVMPKDIDYLAGLEMGGIPIATALSLRTGIPTLFIRKTAKKYGTCKLAEGGDVKNKKLLIVEDVVTAGGAIVDAVSELRKLGAIVDKAFCVINREETGITNLASINVTLTALFTKTFLYNAGSH